MFVSTQPTFASGGYLNSRPRFGNIDTVTINEELLLPIKKNEFTQVSGIDSQNALRVYVKQKNKYVGFKPTFDAIGHTIWITPVDAPDDQSMTWIKFNKAYPDARFYKAVHPEAKLHKVDHSGLS